MIRKQQDVTEKCTACRLETTCDDLKNLRLFPPKLNSLLTDQNNFLFYILTQPTLPLTALKQLLSCVPICGHKVNSIA